MAIVTDPGTTYVADSPAVTVEVKNNLNAVGGWTTTPYLWCKRLQLATNAYQEAELEYHVGEGVIQPGATSNAAYTPLSLRGKFVRITIDVAPTPIVWVGYVVGDKLPRDGVKEVGGVNKLSGADQTIFCVGLAYFLDRKQIESAIVHKEVDEPDEDNPDYVRILRPLVFNGGAKQSLDPGTGQRANRTPTTNVAGAYDFSDDPTTAELWEAGHIVKHLLVFHTTRQLVDDEEVAAPCDWELSPADDLAGYLDGFHPTIETEGRTDFRLLNEIAKPQRRPRVVDGVLRIGRAQDHGPHRLRGDRRGLTSRRRRAAGRGRAAHARLRRGAGRLQRRAQPARPPRLHPSGGPRRTNDVHVHRRHGGRDVRERLDRRKRGRLH